MPVTTVSDLIRNRGHSNAPVFFYHACKSQNICRHMYICVYIYIQNHTCKAHAYAWIHFSILDERKHKLGSQSKVNTDSAHITNQLLKLLTNVIIRIGESVTR